MNGAIIAPGRAVDVHRDVEPGLLLERVERARRSPAIGSYEPSNVEPRMPTTPIVFSSQSFTASSAREVEAVALHRHEPHLDVPVVRELLPADLDVDPHHEVRLVRRLALGLAPLLPPALEREPAEHRRLARPGRRASGRLARVGRVPEVAQDRDAARLELGRLRVLVLVDHVLVEALGHQLLGLRLHPRRDERGHVEPRVAVEHQLVVDDLVRHVRRHLAGRELVSGNRSFAAEQRVDRELAGRCWPWEGCLSVTVLLSWGRCDATPADERSTFSRRRMGLFDRLRRGHAPTAEPEPETPERTVVQIDASSLSRVFSAPMWLRDLGLLAWFLVGVAILLVGLTWLLGLTSTITMPVIVGAILATVAGPLVTKMQQHRIPRPAGAAIVLLGLIALGIVIFLMVVGGLVEQSSEIKKSAQRGRRQDPGLGQRHGRERDLGGDGEREERHDHVGKGADPGSRRRNQGPDLAHLLRDVQRLRNVLPAQGRPLRAQLHRPPPRRARRSRHSDHRERDQVAAALLPRRDDRRRLQRVRRSG